MPTHTGSQGSITTRALIAIVVAVVLGAIAIAARIHPDTSPSATPWRQVLVLNPSVRLAPTDRDGRQLIVVSVIASTPDGRINTRPDPSRPLSVRIQVQGPAFGGVQGFYDNRVPSPGVVLYNYYQPRLPGVVTVTSSITSPNNTMLTCLIVVPDQPRERQFKEFLGAVPVAHQKPLVCEKTLAG